MSINYSLPTHPLQSKEWGEFREKTGVNAIRGRGFQLTIHKIPHAPWTIGYLPKGPLPTKEMIQELEKIGREQKCIFIQIEPNVPMFTSEEPVPVTSEVARFARLDSRLAETRRTARLAARRAEGLLRGGSLKMLGLRPSFHPLFTKYTFILDLTKSEEELLKAMHPKTRYNIKVAQKHGVKVVEDNSDEAFETYLKLTRETTKRQGFYAHSEQYHRLQWKTLPHKIINLPLRPLRREASKAGHKSSIINQLSSHLLLAKYQGKTLVAWIVFVLQDTLYYPYGASSSEHRETMASNLMMWEAIKFGKKLGLKKLDMWGSLGQNPDKNDPWYGFHRFKQGYGGELVELVGSYDLVVNPVIYQLYKIADKLRWVILRLKNIVR